MRRRKTGGYLTENVYLSVPISKPAEAADEAVYIERIATNATLDMTAGAVGKRAFDRDMGGGLELDEIPAEDFAGPERSSRS